MFQYPMASKLRVAVSIGEYPACLSIQ